MRSKPEEVIVKGDQLQSSIDSLQIYSCKYISITIICYKVVRKPI